jgi:hypothetical protein
VSILTGLLTDSNLEKSAMRGCRRGKGKSHNLSGKRTDYFSQSYALFIVFSDSPLSDWEAVIFVLFG